MLYETIHTTIAAGFEIRFSVAPEHVEPEWDFENEADRQNTLDRIERGDLVYFIARVEAVREGIVLGTDYLGGCCYDSYDQFIESSDYFRDMVETSVEEACLTLTKLCKPL
jgi:hypothetical protein